LPGAPLLDEAGIWGAHPPIQSGLAYTDHVRFAVVTAKNGILLFRISGFFLVCSG
jgi:hypothetical protein